MKVKCTRCGLEGEGFEAPPYPGPLGRLIQEKTCPKCFEDWRKFSVNVINDHKLRPFLPQDRGVLEGEMKKYLNLETFEKAEGQVLPSVRK